MTRYLIIEKDKGVFLGTYGILYLFAKTEKMRVIKVYTFSTKKDAERYIEQCLNEDHLEFSIAPIESEFTYVDVVDVIKEGYGKYTHRMMDNVPMRSTMIH